MTSSKRRTVLEICRQQRFVVTIVLLAPLLAGINWILSPGHPLQWLRGMVTLPLLWFVPVLWYTRRRSNRGSSMDDVTATERYFVSVLAMVVVAFGIVQVTRLGLEIWVTLGPPRTDLQRERRILGLAASATLIVLGNTVPKILTPLALLPLPLAERVTSARRFVGTAMVIEGLALAVAFVVLPIDPARAFARWVTLGVLLTILGAVVWMNAGPARRTQ